MSVSIQVKTVRALQDNYCFLVHRAGSQSALVIDPSEASPIELALKKHDLRLGLILNTHHHHDHVGGNEELVRSWSVRVYCSDYDRDRVPQATRGLRDGEKFEFDGIEVQTIYIPGHTLGQVGYYLPQSGDLFVGDTVFSMGCGRLFEGTPEQMLSSLSKIAHLPGATRLHFGHEYTEKNAAFAKSVEPKNERIAARLEETRRALAARGIADAPTISSELQVNPFFRVTSEDIRASLGMPNVKDVEVLARLREMRNTF